MYLEVSVDDVGPMKNRKAIANLTNNLQPLLQCQGLDKKEIMEIRYLFFLIIIISFFSKQKQGVTLRSPRPAPKRELTEPPFTNSVIKNRSPVASSTLHPTCTKCCVQSSCLFFSRQKRKKRNNKNRVTRERRFSCLHAARLEISRAKRRASNWFT